MAAYTNAPSRRLSSGLHQRLENVHNTRQQQQQQPLSENSHRGVMTSCVGNVSDVRSTGDGYCSCSARCNIAPSPAVYKYSMYASYIAQQQKCNSPNISRYTVIIAVPYSTRRSSIRSHKRTDGILLSLTSQSNRPRQPSRLLRRQRYISTTACGYSMHR